MGQFDAHIKDARATDGPGGFEAILSMPTQDRDGEVIDARAFEPLPDHLPIDIDHGMSVATTVASGRPFYVGSQLRFEGSFASTQLGQEVRTLVLEGHVRKMSVAFMSPEKVVKDGRVHIVKAELLNAAIVAIPSNREASILAAKSVRRDLEVRRVIAEARRVLTDLELEAARVVLASDRRGGHVIDLATAHSTARAETVLARARRLTNGGPNARRRY
ncbi:MAG: HK97 family phage prohead protease [Acidimicrobiales bacterium]|nr:HK97 family phage prohead protease [Acidimicrobiales bacterium]